MDGQITPPLKMTLCPPAPTPGLRPYPPPPRVLGPSTLEVFRRMHFHWLLRAPPPTPGPGGAAQTPTGPSPTPASPRGCLPGVGPAGPRQAQNACVPVPEQRACVNTPIQTSDTHVHAAVLMQVCTQGLVLPCPRGGASMDKPGVCGSWGRSSRLCTCLWAPPSDEAPSVAAARPGWSSRA